MKIGIIGSGISGLSIAQLLQVENEVIIFEKESKPGGLIKCERFKDCLFHKVGGHVFNSKNEKVLNWFWSFFDRDKEFVKAKRKAKVYFRNSIIGYPIENYIYLLDKNLVKVIVSEMLELQKLPQKSPLEFENFEIFLKQNFGKTLYEEYFKPYNQKIWRTDLSTVAMNWLDGKLPMPNFLEIFQSNIIREEEANMVHNTFFYPKENGSQFIVERFRKNLNIVTNSYVKSMSANGDKIVIEGLEFDKIIYCGDIRELPDFALEKLKAGGIDMNYLRTLRSNGTSNLFCETDDNDISWLYIPEVFTKAHRIIYTGNFSATNNRGSNRKTCVVEFSGKVDYETMVSEIKNLPGNLTPLTHNYEPNSYVIQDHQTRDFIAEVKKILKVHNIFILGRFAEWEYYNMDKAMEASFALYETNFNS